MKRFFSFLLAVLMIASLCTFSAVASASINHENKTIAIVFDNSGSMYGAKNYAWCRATYAVEVFASMMDRGDKLMIYPMNKIRVRGVEYEYEPLVINDPSEAPIIREILSLDSRAGTPIETIDTAYDGLRGASGEKWLIVITDGTYFHMNGGQLTPAQSRSEVEARFNSIDSSVNTMFLGIGKDAVEPNVPNSYKAKDSGEVLERLTQMCNRIFGRDELPNAERGEVTFDVSMKKLIVFAQGANISDLSVSDASGKPVGAKSGSELTPKYAEYGGFDEVPENPRYQQYFGDPDRDLQGVIITYTDCSSGTYNLSYTGNADRVCVYYEPNVDLRVQLVDSEGNVVTDSDEIAAGHYNIVYGLFDGVTGEPTNSPLLGDVHYDITYTINGDETRVTSGDTSGEIGIDLNADDEFSAKFEVTYLKNYRIVKTNPDFNWPAFFHVSPSPADPLEVKLSGGQESYRLSELTHGEPFIAEIYSGGEQLNAKELGLTELECTSNSNIIFRAEIKGDHYVITPYYNDPAHPETTQCGDVTLTVHAVYRQKDHEDAAAEASVTFNVENDVLGICADIVLPANRIVIADLPDKPIYVDLRMEGTPLTAAEFATVSYTVTITDGGNFIPFTLEEDAEHSRLIINMQNEGVERGDYTVEVHVTALDKLDQETKSSDSKTFKVRLLPGWVVPAIVIVALIVLAALLTIILSQKVLPKKITVVRNANSILLDGAPLTGQLQLRYSGKRGKRGSFTLTSPVPPSASNNVCRITIDLEANTTLFTMLTAKFSQAQRAKVAAKCTNVSFSQTNATTFNGTICGGAFQWVQGMKGFNPNPAAGGALRLYGGQAFSATTTSEQHTLVINLKIKVEP